MRRLIYSVAASLDGFIAGPKGEFDWIPMDPDISFAEVFGRFDTLLMGRHTYEVTQQAEAEGAPKMDKEIIVVSRTLKEEEHPEVQIIREQVAERVEMLKNKEGKDIWLFGGGELFGALLKAGLVDIVEVAVVPILLGEGIPLLPAIGAKTPLKLIKQRAYEKTGLVWLEYAVEKNG